MIVIVTRLARSVKERRNWPLTSSGAAWIIDNLDTESASQRKEDQSE